MSGHCVLKPVFQALSDRFRISVWLRHEATAVCQWEALFADCPDVANITGRVLTISR